MSETLEVPRYKLVLPYFDNATLWPEGTTIQFNGVPNEGMVPQNDSARAKMQAWMDELDRQAAIKAAMSGRAFTQRAPDIGEAVAQEMRDRPRIPREMPQDRLEPVPVRPDMMNTNQKRAYTRKVTADVVSAELPAPPRRGDRGDGPIAILGTTATGDFQAAR